MSTRELLILTKTIPKVDNQYQILYSDKKPVGKKSGKTLEAANRNKI